MGFLEKAKNLLIETEENENVTIGGKNYEITPADREVYSSSVTFERNMDGSKTPIFNESAKIDTSDLISIDEVYSANELDNKDKSIYKVNEIKAALPDMPSDAKKASVIGMLTVSKIGISEIEDDSKSRTDAIIGSLDQFTKETENIINDAETLIAEKEKEIEDLKSKIAARKQLQESQSKLFEDELDLIKKTLDFIV